MAKRTVRNIDCSNKRILIRVDFNVPIEQDGITIAGPNILYNTNIDKFSDHRIALIGEIINLITNKPLSSDRKTKSLIETSFPEFYSIVEELYE